MISLRMLCKIILYCGFIEIISHRIHDHDYRKALYGKLSYGLRTEILVSQQKEIDRLKTELKQAEEELRQRRIAIEKAGSLAEASIAMTNLFEEAQKAADIYLHNIYALGTEYKDALQQKETTDEHVREETSD